MLQSNSIELKRIAVPYAVSFEKRLNQLRYGEESGEFRVSETVRPTIPTVSLSQNPAIVCDIWMLDQINRVYRATMRNDSRFLFLPMTSSEQG